MAISSIMSVLVNEQNLSSYLYGYLSFTFNLNLIDKYLRKYQALSLKFGKPWIYNPQSKNNLLKIFYAYLIEKKTVNS